MQRKTFFFLLSLFICYNFAKDLNYGEFEVTISNFEICKGPKTKNCVLTTATVENGTKVLYKMYVLEKMTPTNGKIVSTSQTNETVRYLMKKPCDHLFIRPVLHTILNVTKNCVILQGNYTFHLDFQDVFQKYYGKSFLYGSWTFKSMFYGSSCNFVCQVLQLNISPKKTT